MKRFLALFFFLAIGKPVFPGTAGADGFQNYKPRFELFQLPGSESNKVQQIVQDKLGYLWFATQNGLIRYDGQNFISYTHNEDDPNSVQSDYIESIYIDSKGIFWLTHWQTGSLTSFDPSQEIFTKYASDPNNPESLLPGELSVLAEDKTGYIWIGGQNGLNRLDRNTGKVKRFQNDPDNPNSLSCNKVRALYVDGKGTLWAGTGFPWEDNEQRRSEGGLNRYNPGNESFTRYLHNPDDPNTLANNIVRAIFEDSKGNFWIGTAGDGLHLMDRETGKFTRLSYDPQNPGKFTRPYPDGLNPETIPYFSHITSVYEDRQNRIWISAVEGGLNVYDPASGLTRHFEKGSGENDLKTNFIWNVFQSRDNTFWVCTGQDGAAVYKIKDRDFSFPFFKLNEKQITEVMEFHGILKDKSGRYWMLQNNPGRVLRIDRQKNIVEEIPVGGQRFTNGVFFGGISSDLDGNIWISTWKGIYRCKATDSEFKLFQTGKFKNENVLISVAPVLQTRNGFYWFAAWPDEGVVRYNPQNDEIVTFKNNPDDPSTIAGNRILGFYEDDKGNVWMSGGSEIREPGKPLFVDRYNPQTNSFEHFIDNKNLKGIAFDLTADDKGNIWFIDFSDGLYKINSVTGVLKKFSSSNGVFPKSQLFSLKKDKTGKFWLCNDTSIMEFDPESETLSLFGPGQAVKTLRYSYNSGNIAPDGELLFARENGFHFFYPEEILPDKKSSIPDIRITGFQLFDDQTDNNSQGTFKSILNSPYLSGKQIKLTHTENVFSFSVASFNFYNPETNRLQFMLEGFDRDWRTDLTNGITPYYINVPPGNYTFHLRGTNSYGILEKEGVILKITILPPWWKTFWAYVLYGLLFIGAVFAVDRIQRRRLLNKERAVAREKELLQAREIEKAYNKLKITQAQLIQSEKLASLGELTAGIAHEIQNPLNFIKNFSEVSNEMVNELKEELAEGRQHYAEGSIQAGEEKLKLAVDITNDIRKNLEKISYHGQRADSIVKNMLRHSTGGTGQKQPTDINSLCDEFLRLAYHGMRAKDNRFNVKTETDFDRNIGRINIVPQDIGRVLLNLINNAFYAVSERKKLNEPVYEPTVIVSTTEFNPPLGGAGGVSSAGGLRGVCISVKDNGPGIPANILDKIFQPFFTTKPTGEGTGLGLSLAYDIITKGHKGELTVQTKEGEGTTFIVKLPV